VTEHLYAAKSDHTIRGLGAVYHVNGDPKTEYRYTDTDGTPVVMRIRRGAFAGNLGRDIISQFNHVDILLGRVSNGTLTLKETARGLRYTLTPPDTERVRELLAAIARGDVKGSSVAYKVPPGGERYSEGVDDIGGRPCLYRDVFEMKISEVGPVVMPAFAGTTAEVVTDGVAERTAPTRTSVGRDMGIVRVTTGGIMSPEVGGFDRVRRRASGPVGRGENVAATVVGRSGIF